MPVKIPAMTINGTDLPPTVLSLDPVDETRPIMANDDTMTSKLLQRGTGERMTGLVTASLTNKNTGHTVVTVSSSATEYPKWEKANQSTALTTNAKPTKTAKNASVKNMATNASVNLSDTHGNSLPNLMLSSHVTLPEHANVNFLNATCNLSKILLHKRNNFQMIIMHSGLKLVSTEKKSHHVRPEAIPQSNTNAAVVIPNHISGLVLTKANAVMVMS